MTIPRFNIIDFIHGGQPPCTPVPLLRVLAACNCLVCLQAVSPGKTNLLFASLRHNPPLLSALLFARLYFRSVAPLPTKQSLCGNPISVPADEIDCTPFFTAFATSHKHSAITACLKRIFSRYSSRVLMILKDGQRRAALVWAEQLQTSKAKTRQREYGGAFPHI